MKLLSQHYRHKGETRQLVVEISTSAIAAQLWHLCWGLGIVSVGMALSMLVCLYGTMMTGARIPFAISRERCFFHALAQVHPRFRTPPTAIAVQAALAVALMLLAQSFRHLFSLTLFAEYVFYIAATASVFAAIVDGCRVQRRAFLPGRFCFLRLVRG